MNKSLTNKIYHTIQTENVNDYDLKKMFKSNSEVEVNNSLIFLLLTEKIRVNQDSLKYVVTE